jgi:predicted nucleic acid-binding protein
MNRYLVDTNILLLYLRQDSRTQFIDTVYNPLAMSATSIISVVTEGEIRSIALQRHWGQPKLKALEAMLKKFLKRTFMFKKSLQLMLKSMLIVKVHCNPNSFL